MSASASVYTLTPLPYQEASVVLAQADSRGGSGSPNRTHLRLGWLKHRGLNWDPIRAQLDR